MDQKKKLAFVDNSFHRLTASARFFQELLEKEYHVTTFFHESWQQAGLAEFNALERGAFDVVVFWQTLPALRQVSRLRCRSVIWVPMFDEEHRRSNLLWKAVASLAIKVVAFSRSIHRTAESFGIQSLYLQYFPEPRDLVSSYEIPRVFLWQRSTAIGWTLIKCLLAGNDSLSVTLRDNPDPNQTFDEPSSEDVRQFKIEIIRDRPIADSLNNEAYLRLLAASNVFVAPRVAEGIGMSFLEAMGMGMCVIGANQATMNEYISSGENGFLFDLCEPQAVNLAEFERCGRTARDYIKEGRRRWEASIPGLYRFLGDASSSGRSRASGIISSAWDIAYGLRNQAFRLGLTESIFAKKRVK